MNYKQQTSVDWLIKELKEKEYLGTFCTADAWEREEQQMRLIIEQAKEMEKQQIIDAYAQGFIESESMDKGAEQYYKETYGE